MIAINNSRTITIADIRNSVGELAVLSRYFNISEIPKTVSSPLREDNSPSFFIYLKNGNEVRYFDMSKDLSGSLYDMICEKYNLSLSQALEMIYRDLMKGLKFNDDKPIVNSNLIVNQERKHVECKTRELRSYDIEFWARYGITEKALKFGRIYPISHTIITHMGVRRVITCGKYSYAFVEFKDGKTTIKVYNPYSEYKWVNGHDVSVIDLWDKLPKTGDELIITSSRKDALCLWCNIRIPSISFQSESTTPKESVMNELKSRFKTIYVLYDNDYNKESNPGRRFGKAIADKFGLIQVEIPSEYEAKDPSDLYKKINKKDKFISIIKNILKK